MIILTDSSGEAIWEIPWMIHSQFIGEGFQSVCNGNSIYSAISKYARSPDTTHCAPCLIKTSTTGVPLYYRKLIDPIDYGKASTITKISDNIFFIGECYVPSYYTTPTLSALKTDTLGNVIKEKVLSHTEYIPRDALLTHDNKYLITANDWVSDILAIKLWKLNLNLDFDSVYTRPFTYDSLCPHPITSSTLYFQCDVVEGIQKPAMNTEKVRMVVYPNPGDGIVHINMPECIQKPSETQHFNVITVFHKWTKNLEFQVFDPIGRLIFTQSVPPDQKEISLDVSSWSPGVCLFRLVYDNRTVATEKFVKR